MAVLRKRELKRLEQLMEGEVVGTSRKSSDGEKAGKSLEGQEESILETCAEYGLPITREYLWREAPGMSGKLWWACGGASGIEGDERGGQKTRPVLTKIVNGIVSGEIRCVVVWSLDRLARHVGIMEALIELMNEYGCLLYDRRGPVDIHTAEGRNNVRNSATAAQYQRERAQVDAPRGVEHNKRKGKIVINANRLGFRAVGKASGEIIHKPDEQDLVYELFHLRAIGALSNSRFGLGDPAHGPYGVHDIAELISARPDLPWIDEVYPGRIERDGGGRAVHPATLYNILSDPIYQGRQRHGGKESPCPIFLREDGSPVVPEWLYEAVQEKKVIGANRGIKKTSRSLSCLIRCGVCGIGLIANVTTTCSIPAENGARALVPAWCATSQKGTSRRCNHKLPVLRIDFVDEYMYQHLAPELLAQLQTSRDIGEQAALANERASIARCLADAEHRLNVELPRYLVRNLGKMDDMAVSMKACLQEEIAGYTIRLREIERHFSSDHSKRLADGIESLRDLPPLAKHDLLRQVIQWVAVVPTVVQEGRRGCRARKGDGSAVTGGSAKNKAYPIVTGRLVFLTTWGTMHTAVIYQERWEHSHMPVTRLRPARIDEVLGSVHDLPDLALFIDGVKHSYAATWTLFELAKVAPGYLGGEPSVPVFEFISAGGTDSGSSGSHKTEEVFVGTMIETTVTHPPGKAEAIRKEADGQQ